MRYLKTKIVVLLLKSERPSRNRREFISDILIGEDRNREWKILVLYYKDST